MANLGGPRTPSWGKGDLKLSLKGRPPIESGNGPDYLCGGSRTSDGYRGSNHTAKGEISGLEEDAKAASRGGRKTETMKFFCRAYLPKKRRRTVRA